MKPPSHIGVVVICGPGPEAAVSAGKCLVHAGHKEGLVWAVTPAGAEASEAVRAHFGGSQVIASPGGEGLAARCNRGIREALRAGADYVLLLADSCRPEPGSLSPLLIALEAQRTAGVACPALVDGATGRIEACGGQYHRSTARAVVRLRGREPAGPAARTWEAVDYAPAACVLLKRDFLEDVGLYHAAFGSCLFEVEMGLRACKELWSTVAVPQARVVWIAPKTEKRDVRDAYERARNPLWLQRGWGRPVARLATLPFAMVWSWPAAFAAHLFTGRFRCAGAVVRGALSGLFCSGWQSWEHLALPSEGRKVHLATPSAVREMARYL